MQRLGFLVFFLFAALPAQAKKLRVVTDIAPVHSLVSQVAGDMAEVSLLVRPGASPHGYALRPSEARKLQQADIVIWVGHENTPWLERAIANLAPGAKAYSLLDVAGTVHWPRRTTIVFPHDHGHGDNDGDDHDHDHDAGGAKDGHQALDPHAWLDPANANNWIGFTATLLATEDPQNSEAYLENADAAKAENAKLREEIRTILDPVRGRSFVAGHDAFQYFETRFEFPSLAAVTATDAAAPGAARVATLHELLEKGDVDCLFVEPTSNRRLAATLVEGTATRIATLDPIGSQLTPGAAFYGALLRQIATNLVTCLSK